MRPERLRALVIISTVSLRRSSAGVHQLAKPVGQRTKPGMLLPAIVSSGVRLFQPWDPALRLFPFLYRFSMSITIGDGGLIGYDGAWDTSALSFPDVEFTVDTTVTFTNAKGERKSFSYGELEGGKSWPGHPAFGGQGYWWWNTSSQIVSFDVKLIVVSSHDLGNAVIGVDHIHVRLPPGRPVVNIRPDRSS